MLDTLKGELRIFTKEVEVKKGKKTTNRILYSACVGGTKQDDDSYINYYIPVNFSNAVTKLIEDVKDEESFDVIVKEAWIKAYKDKDDNIKPILFINSAKVVK